MMKKSEKGNEPVVQTNAPGQNAEKLWIVQYFTVRRHSRTLYLPLDPTVVRLHDIQKGDIVKAMILEVRKAPRPDDENEPESGEL
jgi:hypothetical protein